MASRSALAVNEARPIDSSYDWAAWGANLAEKVSRLFVGRDQIPRAGW